MLFGSSALLSRVSFAVRDWGTQDLPEHADGHTVLAVMTSQERVATFGLRGSLALPPDTLRSLIEALARLSPRVIAVDLRTDSSVWTDARLPEVEPTVVWSFDVDQQDSLRIRNPLGGRVPQPQFSGLAVVPRDADDRIRQYVPFWMSETHPTLASFPHAVVEAFCAGSAAASDCVHRTRFKSRADSGAPHLFLSRRDESIRRISIPQLMRAIRASFGDSATIDSLRNIARGRIILVGSDKGPDTHMTADAMLNGSAVNARIIESELSNSLLRKMSKLSQTLIKIALAVLIGLVFHAGSPGRATLLLIGLVATCLWLARNPGTINGLWLDVVPLIVGFWLEHIVESYLMARRLLQQSSPTA